MKIQPQTQDQLKPLAELLARQRVVMLTLHERGGLGVCAAEPGSS